MNERRFTTVHDRYQVVDPCCGLVCTTTTKGAALVEATRHWTRHTEPLEWIVVYDVMARRSAVREWRVSRDGTATPQPRVMGIETAGAM